MMARGGGNGAKAGFAHVTPSLAARMSKEELLATMAEADLRVENTSFSRIALEGVAANGTAFENVVFHNCTFERVRFSNITLTDVRFEGCRLIRCDLSRSWLNRCDFRSCSAPGLSFNRSRLTNVLFDDCQLGYTDFSEVSATGLTVRETSLTEASFHEAKAFRHVALERCNLTCATVFRTPLAGIDLSTCEISGIRVSDNYRELKGALVSAEQAVQLAQLLGVTVKEDEWL